MKTFTKTTFTKPQIMKRLHAHAKADEIVQGRYWDNGKGCAVGCTIHGSSHGQYEGCFGIPRVLAKLEDVIFEGLTRAEAKEWPLRFMRAVPVGTDLQWVWPKFALWLLNEKLPTLTKNEKSLAAIRDVKFLHEEWISTGVKPEVSRWRSAAAYAAYAARTKFWREAADCLERLLKESKGTTKGKGVEE